MEITKQLLTENRCFKLGKTIRLKGVMVHSTGANNPKLCRYVPGNSEIGWNKSGNHWNVYQPGGRSVCVHAFIGKKADGSVGAVQTLPWNLLGWHAGGTANNTHIGFEICEDGLTDKGYFEATYQKAVELTAMLCLDYDLDPLEDGVVICHAEGHKLGIASNHGDVLHWWRRYGVTMDDFRQEVKKEMARITQEDFNLMMDVWIAQQAKRGASAWALAGLEEAKKLGITDGSRPLSYATRQEVALMVKKALTLSE